MPLPKFVVPAGAIDGSNVLFTTPTAYTPGTVAVFLNGQLIRQIDDDGWIESSPALGQVTLKEAPIVDDVVQIFYLDTTPVLPGEEVCAISGTISVDGEDELVAVWAEEGSLVSSLGEEAGILGLVSEVGVLTAQTSEVGEIHGVLEAVCG